MSLFEVFPFLSQTQVLHAQMSATFLTQGSGSDIWQIMDPAASTLSSSHWILKIPRPGCISAEGDFFSFWQTFGTEKQQRHLVLPVAQYLPEETAPYGAWLLPYIAPVQEMSFCQYRLQADALACLHHQDGQFSQKPQTPELTPGAIIQLWVKDWLAICRMAMSEEDQKIYRYLSTAYEHLRRQGTDLRSSEVPILCHRDLTPENWLYREGIDGQYHACLIDWEWAAWQHRVWDLAYWIADIPAYWGLKPDISPRPNRPSPARMLQMYQKASAAKLLDCVVDDIYHLCPWIDLGCLSWGFALWLQHKGRCHSILERKICDFRALMPSLIFGPGRYLEVEHE